MNNNCITVLADKNYIHFFEKLHNDIREVGKYTGDIVLLTDRRTNCSKIRKINDKKIIIARFDKIKFSREANKELNKIPSGRNKSKPFQWHKINLFDNYFKQWNYIFYLDINMKIRGDINEILKLGKKGILYAPFDAYPNLDWKLGSQFNTKSKTYELLKQKYNLDNPKYFQTGILFFDSNLIEKNTKDNLIKLVEKFPISKTNEQGIMNLYFIYEKNVFSRFPVEISNDITYSYWRIRDRNSIITKRDIYEFEK